MSWSVPSVNFSEVDIIERDVQELTAVPVFVGFTAQPAGSLQRVASWDAFLAQHMHGIAAASTTPLAVALHLYFDNGGQPAWILSAGSAPADGTDNADIAEALQAAIQSDSLAAEPQITLLCAPDIVLLEPGPHGIAWLTLWQVMLQVCRDRPQCFALLDLPQDRLAAMTVLRDAMWLSHAEFGAVYWPHLDTRYRDAEGWMTAVPSAAVAAVIKQTDEQRWVWKAPANVAVDLVVRPQYTLQTAQEVFSQPVPVNLLRSFPGRGLRVWGCRTLTTLPTSPWRFIQVRRLLSYVEAHLSNVSQFCVFEPNYEITWFKLKSVCRSWLRNLWLRGALHGTSEEEAFRIFVGLDESMSQDDIVAGRLIVKVEVAALYPAQFIDVSLQFNLMEVQARLVKELT